MLLFNIMSLYYYTSDEMERNVPVLLQLLEPGKSRHRSTPITACRTQRRSAPSLLGATLVATVNQLIKQLLIVYSSLFVLCGRVLS